MSENPGTAPVRELLDHVHNGQYVIPYFQRGFEWQPSMVCDLVESILQNYFTGLILMWDLNIAESKKEAWEAIWGAEISTKPEKAILDGQQRLSSLYFATYNPNKKFPYRKSYYLFYLNLNMVLNGDYDDAVTYKYFTSHQKWEQLVKYKDSWAEEGIVPISILSAKDVINPNTSYLDTKEFESWLSKYVEHNKGKLPDDVTTLKVNKVFTSILHYPVVTYPLSSHRDLHDICNIFARVNAKGMKLSTFDLMNAFLYPKGVKLRKELWEGLNNDLLKSIDSSMNEYLLKIVSLVKQNYCSSKYLYNLIPGEKTTRKDEEGKKYEEVLVQDGKEFIMLWKKACNKAEKAREIIMNTGETDFGATKRDFIPNSTILPVVAAILWEFDGDADDIYFKKNLQKWYWSAVISEEYSGSVDSVMSKDFRDWKAWLTSGKHIERINMVNKDFINEIDLKTVYRGSARYNAILCMMALNDIKDFYKGRIVGTGDYTDGRINDHHIFPNQVKGLDIEKSKSFVDSKDRIVNRTLLFDETNNKIKNGKPSQYIQTMIEKNDHDEEKVKGILKKHMISGAAYRFLKEDDFDSFIIEREEEIKRHIINKLGLE